MSQNPSLAELRATYFQAKEGFIPDAVKALFAALEVAPRDEELLLEALCWFEHEFYAPNQWKRRVALAEQLGRVIRDWPDEDTAWWRGELAWMCVDKWQVTDAHPQYVCDVAGGVLRADPHHQRALELFVETELEHGYNHRGWDLEGAAKACADPKRRAELMLYDGYVDLLLDKLDGRQPRRERAEVEAKARAVDPGLDAESVWRRCMERMRGHSALEGADDEP